jgi:broad specificity phosphatase PhoE
VTTIFLVRHALHNFGPTRLAGRLPEVALSDKGRAEAERVAERLRREAVTMLQSSPQGRCRETAAPIAEASGVSVEVVEALDEVDFGEWAGRSFAELDADPRWVAWNIERDYAATAGGETITNLAKRAVGHIETCHNAHAGARIVMVTHAEVIRTVVLRYLGMPFTGFTRLEIEPASITRLILTDSGPVLAGFNEKVVA